jgi:hypothetical protein
VLVNAGDDWCSQETSVKAGVAEHLGQDKIDAVINMAGVEYIRDRCHDYRIFSPNNLAKKCGFDSKCYKGGAAVARR